MISRASATVLGRAKYPETGGRSMQKKWTLLKSKELSCCESKSLVLRFAPPAVSAQEGTVRETPADPSSHTKMATPGYFQLSIPVHTESIVTLPLAHCSNTSTAEHTVQRYSLTQ